MEPPRTLSSLLRDAGWARDLAPAERERVAAETIERRVASGGYVCRKGEAVEHWIGVVDGLVKMANVTPEGKSTTFTGVPAGGWFGEGSLLKDEPRRYDIVAMRDTRVALMPRATFLRLLETSLAFNRYLLVQLNERLGQFIGMVETERFHDPEGRVARCLAMLYNPQLSPGIDARLEISQEEIGLLAGVSRQRVNQALQALEKAGLLKIEYGAVAIVDLEGLRAFGG